MNLIDTSRNCRSKRCLNSTWTPYWSDIVGYWQFDEASTSRIAIDSTGNGNTGTVYGTVTFETTGKVDTAARFSGSDGNYIQAAWPSNSAGSDLTNALNSGALSVCAWVYPTSVTGELGIVGIGSLTSGINLAVTNGIIYFWYTGRNITQGGLLLNNNWYHVCGVVESGLDISIYVNGGAVLTRGSSGGLSTYSLSGTTRLIIGQERDLISGRYFPGIIDDVAIWKRSLSASDISNLYNSQK
ncbi:MAG: LamG domain-containing protein [Myxococcaceae bacterium]